MGRILIRGEAGHDIVADLYPAPGEPVIDKPGKGAFHQTDLDQVLKNSDVDTLMVCGVTTEVCVHTTIREGNDRGYRCVAIGDACASYFPEFHRIGLEMIKAQGGIFGWVSDSAAFARALDGARGGMTRRDRTMERRLNSGFRGLERLLRIWHQHPRQPSGPDGAAAVRAADAERDHLRTHPARAGADDVPVDVLLRLARLAPCE